MQRRGTSVFRIGLLIGIVGFVVIVIGILSFYFDQLSRQTPLEIAPFPGAALIGERPISNNHRLRQYHVTGATPDDVAAYYNQKMSEHYGGESGERCVRVPEVGELEILEPGTVPFEFVCNFDRSGFRATQYTTVTIQPGVFDEDPAQNTEGRVVVQYEQFWQAG